MKYKYAVQFCDNTIKIFEAEDEVELLFIITGYYGICNDVYKISMRGCENLNEYMLITNTLLQYHNYQAITKIYLIENIVWEI